MKSEDADNAAEQRRVKGNPVVFGLKIQVCFYLPWVVTMELGKSYYCMKYTRTAFKDHLYFVSTISTTLTVL